MVSPSQKRIYSIIVFSLTVFPISTIAISPAMADSKNTAAHDTASHHHFLGNILRHISALVSHQHPGIVPTSLSSSVQKISSTSHDPNTAADQVNIAYSSSMHPSAIYPQIWQPKTVSVTALPENQPFVGINTTEPKHPYLKGLRDVLSNVLSLLPSPISKFAHKIGLISPPSADEEGKLQWSGMNVTDYSGPIPQQAGIPMEAVHLDPHLMTPDAGQGYRIMYSTTNVNNDPAVSTAEILLPKGPAPEGGWKVIDWAHGTTGIGDNATPSATNRYDAPYLNHLLQEGYAVVSTDYVGLGTPGIMAYLAEKSEAANVNDALLASEKIQGLPLSKTFMIDGHSQGGGAALAAADNIRKRIAGTDLDYRGAIASAPAPSLAPEAPIFGTPLATLISRLSPVTGAHALLALTAVRQYHGDNFDMDKYLTPYGKSILQDAITKTSTELTKEAGSVDFAKMWTEPTYKIPGFTKAFDITALPTNNIKDPTLVVQGLLDGEVPAPLTAALNIITNSHGQKNIHYKYYPLETHQNINLIGTRSLKNQDQFLNERMGGSGISIDTDTSSSTPAAPISPTVDLLH